MASRCIGASTTRVLFGYLVEQFARRLSHASRSHQTPSFPPSFVNHPLITSDYTSQPPPCQNTKKTTSTRPLILCSRFVRSRISLIIVNIDDREPSGNRSCMEPPQSGFSFQRTHGPSNLFLLLKTHFFPHLYHVPS